MSKECPQITTLDKIAEDIEANPDLVKYYPGQFGECDFVHFRTSRYYFEWCMQSGTQSTMQIRQPGCTSVYRLDSQIPYAILAGQKFVCLEQREQQKATIAIRFIVQAIDATQKPV